MPPVGPIVHFEPSSQLTGLNIKLNQPEALNAHNLQLTAHTGKYKGGPTNDLSRIFLKEAWGVELLNFTSRGGVLLQAVWGLEL